MAGAENDTEIATQEKEPLNKGSMGGVAILEENLYRKILLGTSIDDRGP